MRRWLQLCWQILARVGAQQSSVARWLMTSSLSGTFKFSATFTHADLAGSSVTSLLTARILTCSCMTVLIDLPDVMRSEIFWPKMEMSSCLPNRKVQFFRERCVDFRLACLRWLCLPIFTYPPFPGFLYAKVSDPFNGQQAVHKSATRGWQADQPEQRLVLQDFQYDEQPMELLLRSFRHQTIRAASPTRLFLGPIRYRPFSDR